MRYTNYLILFILITLGVIFKDNISLSTNLLSLFASKESVERLDIATELGYTKEMLVAVKGFDSSSKKIVDELSKQFEDVDGIELVQSKTTPSKEIQEYYKKFYPLLAKFDDAQLSEKSVNSKLQKLHDSLSESFFYTPIDKNDPLKLFSFKTQKSSHITTRGEYITLGEYGYLIRIKTDVAPSQMGKAKSLYDDVKVITSKYENVIAFGGFFYTVENSKEIKDNITLIVALCSVLLLVMYLVLLRDVKLLSNTLVTFFSSMIFALLMSSWLYDGFHVMSLAFGVSVSAVSIDYLFHYYFHNFYQSKKRVDRSVLYGFLTTTSAFAIFSFIPVALISQISFFTVMALSFAYLVFTFVFPFLNLKEYKAESKEKKVFKVIPSYIVLVISIVLLVYTYVNIKFDNNIRNLDYQNKELQAIEMIFKDAQKEKFYPVIVEAKTIDSLITNLHKLDANVSESFSLASFVLSKDECLKRKNILKNYDFKKLNRIVNKEAENIGFRDGYFNSSYNFISTTPSCDEFDLNLFKPYNLSVVNKDSKLYTVALVKETKDIEKLGFVSVLDIKTMFEKVSKQMFDDISIYSLYVLMAILLLIMLSVKRRFFYAINYILFPLALALSVIVTFYEVNVMHIFSLIILVAIGIDYGIYMSNSNKPTNTMLAIKYSLLSTFAAFGVLIFSTITALNSIGLVITLGIVAIFILIKVMR